MTAREEVLTRIRQALDASRPADRPVPRDYRRVGEEPLTAAALVDLLAERLADYRAGVTRVAMPVARTAIGQVLARHAARRVVVPAGFPAGLAPPGVDVVTDEPSLSPSELDGVDGVLTTCAVAVAETGTLVLDAGPGQGRRALTLVPDLHLVVVRLGDVVRGVPEALTRLDPTRPLTWISGPSATSDIELNRVEGVHGPRRLEVVLVEA